MSGKKRRHYTAKQLAAGFGGKRHKKARHHKKLRGTAHARTRHVTVIPKQLIVSGKRRHHKRHHGGKLMGGIQGRGLMSRAMGATMEIASGTGGYIVGSYVGNMIPITGANAPMIKGAIVTLAGVVTAALMPARVLQAAGLGIGLAGSAALAKAFVPSLPYMSGTYQLSGMAHQSLLGMAQRANKGSMLGMARHTVPMLGRPAGMKYNLG
jgi:hypothetical protein